MDSLCFESRAPGNVRQPNFVINISHQGYRERESTTQGACNKVATFFALLELVSQQFPSELAVQTASIREVA